MESGTRIGVYEITDKLGEGGMGEVYRARDTKLNRDVALKVLPPLFTGDPDRLARFEREAQALAALNHPNIAHVYGFEHVGDVRAIVMELVPGQTLAEVIAGAGRSPVDFGEARAERSGDARLQPRATSAGTEPPGLPWPNALAIARQIAEALEAAHEQGIIHRDLKPANIKVGDDGVVKVLDFGLARTQDAGPGAPDPSNSPTLTARATQLGMILGTAAYMAPEQAKGKPVDRRADVWAFGVVLYEMLTGKRAFEGSDISETMASVLAREPDWTALPADTPPSIVKLLRQCLEKDRRERTPDIAVARFAVRDVLTAPEPAAGAAVPPPPSRPKWRRAAPIAAAALGAAAVTAAVMWVARPTPRAGVVSRFVIPYGEGQTRTVTSRASIAISPDGTHLAYPANRQIYLRAIADLEARPIAGTETVNAVGNPFSLVFSPDGRAIAYWQQADQTIKRIEIIGGAPVTICPVEASPTGLTWSGEFIVYAVGGGIARVPAAGGQPERLIELEEGETAVRPQLLQDGRVLYAVAAGPDAGRNRWTGARIVVQTPGDATRTTLVEGGVDARYLPTGHLLYAAAGVLFARPLDLSSLTVGGAVSVVEGVRHASGSGVGTAWFGVSDTGTLVYFPGPVGSTGTGDSTLALFDRGGTAQALDVPPGPYSEPRMSPDGRQIAFGRDDDRDVSIWVYELATGRSARRLTFGGRDRFPVWSADSERVIFQSDREGDLGLYWQRADGTGTAERLTKPGEGATHVAQSVSPDGAVLLIDETAAGTTTLMALSLEDRAPAPYGGVTSSTPTGAAFSPDGRWVAYSTRGPGQPTNITFVQPFPATGAQSQVSGNAEDGHHQTWAPDGKELYYTPGPGDRLTAVAVTTTAGFAFGPAPPVSRPFRSDSPQVERPYDVARNGRAFLGLMQGSTGSSNQFRDEIRVVLNWHEELKARAPAGR